MALTDTASNRMSSRLSEDSPAEVDSAVEEFREELSPASECSCQPIDDVIRELQLMKDSFIATFREKGGVEDHCAALDIEIGAMINGHLEKISSAAISIAKNKIRDVIPNDPADAGVALPPVSKAGLEAALKEKKDEIGIQLVKMMKEVEHYHFSWYSAECASDFDAEFESWAKTVRGNLLYLLCSLIRMISTYHD
jgi:hypothetical protein